MPSRDYFSEKSSPGFALLVGRRAGGVLEAEESFAEGVDHNLRLGVQGQLAHDAHAMRLGRARRNEEPLADLGVGEALGHQMKNLALTRRELVVGIAFRAALVADRACECGGGLGTHVVTAMGDEVQRLEELGGPGRLQDVPHRALLESRQDEIVTVERRHNHDAQVRDLLQYLLDNVQSMQAGEAKVEHEDLRPKVLDGGHDGEAVTDLPHHDVACGFEDAAQPRSNERMIVCDYYAGHGTYLLDERL